MQGVAKKKAQTMPSALAVRFDTQTQARLLAAASRAKFLDGKISWALRAIVAEWLHELGTEDVEAIAAAMDEAYVRSKTRPTNADRKWAKEIVEAVEREAEGDREAPGGGPGAGGKRRARGA